MSLPISKSEKDAVKAELLLGGEAEPLEGESEEDADKRGIDDLTSRVIHAFLEVRDSREMYGHMVYQRTKSPQVPNVYGPWATVATANKNLPAGLEGDRAVLVKIHTGKAER